MATINKYHCKSCSYSAMVSGGKDIRKSGCTITMVCLNCNNLYDALKTIMVENFEETYSNCEHCRSKKNIIWDENKKSCPRCDDSMEIDENDSGILLD